MKHKWILWVTCFALILGMCTACSSGGVAEQAQTAEHTLTGHMDLQYAQEFTVDYYSDGTAYILIHGEFPFLLVPEGVTVSDEVIGDAVVIQQPLNSIYQASSAMVDPFLQIGALDKIRMTSTDENNWAYAATTCADKILEVNPHALIFIEGVEQYPKTELGYTYDTPDIFNAPADKSPWCGAWWGGNLRGVRDYPITPKSGTSQIVYSPHDYGPSVFKQTWFEKDFTEQTLLDDYWYDTWAYINKENIAPLLIGEWGGHMDGTKNQTWMELLRDFMIKNHINHTFWCLNPNSGDTAGLLSYDFLKWDEVKYGMFEEALWQTQKTGKYIGLDHQVALGENGISLNDYIANYAKVEGSNIDGGSTPENVTPVTGVSSAATTTTTTTKTNDATTTTTTTTTATTTVKKESKVFLGDVALDGQISVADIVAVLQYSANNIKYKLDEDALANGDVNGDGDVNAKDAFIIQKVDAKLIAQDSLPVAD